MPPLSCTSHSLHSFPQIHPHIPTLSLPSTMRNCLQDSSSNIIAISSFLIVLLLPPAVMAECTCDLGAEHHNRSKSLKYKLVAIASILLAGAFGVSFPLLARKIQALKPENDLFFMVKAFAAGVILATGFIHILPDAFDALKSPCLKNHHPWSDFPFAGFIAMMSSIGTLMIDSFATCFYNKMHFNNKQVIVDDEILADNHSGHVHVHTHSSHGHSHGSSTDLSSSDHIRHRVVSQVLELGIAVHSVIIGISLGASQSPAKIKPLLAALSFHQFFEGMGLGGCISQAKFKSVSAAIMAILFSLTTPVGIVIGIGIASAYNEKTPTALIVEGIFYSASAGILIYMALVDLLAEDFMNPKMQANARLQVGANLALLLGTACMSFLAIWA